MSQLVYLKAQRGCLKSFIEKGIQKANEYLGPIRDDELESTILNSEETVVKLRDYLSQFRTLNLNISENLEGKPEAEIQQDAEASIAVEMELSETVSKLCAWTPVLQKRLEKLETKDTTEYKRLEIEERRLKLEELHFQNEAEENKRRKVRDEAAAVAATKPKISLPIFDGNFLNWQNFWGRFESEIHNSKLYASITKLGILKGVLSGEPLDIVDGLGESNEVYSEAVRLLRERYDRPDKIKNAHINALLSLPAPNTKTLSLRTFYNSLQKHIRSLNSMNSPADDQFTVNLICGKLPDSVCISVTERRASIGKNSWTLDFLLQLLNGYIEAREQVNDDRNGKADPHKNSGERSPGPGFAEKPPGRPGMGQQRQRPSQPTGSGLSAFPKSGCIYCKGEHWSDQCADFPNHQSRREKIKGRCFVCFRPMHSREKCPNKEKPCVYCAAVGKHHRSLCPKQFPTVEPRPSSNNSGPSGAALLKQMDKAEKVDTPKKEKKPEHSDLVQSENSLLASGEQVLLQTATVAVKNPENSAETSIRVLLDPGSHRTYISWELAKTLKLKTRKCESIPVFTFGEDKAKNYSSSAAEIQIELKDGSSKIMTVNVVKKVSGNLHRMPIDSEKIITSLRACEKKLADKIPTEEGNTTLDFLIGSDYYLDFILPAKIQVDDGLYLLNSTLGWILSGRIEGIPGHQPENNFLILNQGRFTPSFTSVPALSMQMYPDPSMVKKPDMEQLWKPDAIGIRDFSDVPDDEIALKQFNDTVVKEDGRYMATWPWKEAEPDLPENFELAKGRLNSLIRRLSQHPEILKKYNSIIQEQVEKGIIEKVSPEMEMGKLIHYIPHHAVMRDDHVTTKVRIVYDASAKTKRGNNLSLNECLYSGPNMLKDLPGLLIRFR